MKNLPSCATQTREREHLGFIEEYYLQTDKLSEFGQYLGSRSIQDSAQPLGAEKREYLTLSEELILKRSWSKSARIAPGTKVIRVVWPLQGRELNR